ncbi:MAG: hypothetical protein EXS18_04790 [Verrucomicrobiae bacterium]|nr:hypothetical protein [Verrucomicrobiae bacterium]
MTRTGSIALIRNTQSAGAAYLCRGMETTLRHVGLVTTLLNDTEVESGTLAKHRLVLLPCNPDLSPSATQCLQDFTRRGGKLILGLTPTSEMLVLLGLKRLKVRPIEAREMVFTHKALHGLPPRVFLSTRQIVLCKAEPTVRAIAQWRTLQDLSVNDPAAYLAPNGALLTTATVTAGAHMQYAEDRIHLGRLIATLANHFLHDFDLLRFQRRLTEQLSDDEDLVREARPREFEVRALWLPHIPTQNEVALIARQNFNLICPTIGPIAVRAYEHKTFHRPWQLTNLLTECVDQAHRSGLEVFPYVTAWPLPSEEMRRFFDGTGRILRHEPSAAGNPQPAWMCPTHPENQQLLIDAVTKLLDDFGVDGVVLGGFRFPDDTSCVCEGCRQRFAERTERKIGPRPMNLQQRHAVWQNWRHESLTDLLGRLLTACRATNPNAKLALATLPSWDMIPKQFGQDPAGWAPQHLADIFFAMDFTAESETFRGELDHQIKSAAGGARVCAGLGVYSSSSEISSAADLVRQIQIVRELEADGFLLWHSHPAFLEEQFGEGLRAGALRSPAKLPWHPNAPSRPAREHSSVKAPKRRIGLVLPVAEY